jgi:hypothetical protein
MHPYLIKLGVPFPVQEFFEPAYRTDKHGNLLFDYSDGSENYGLAWHRLPSSDGFWMAGQTQLQMAGHVIITTSAMEAIAYLSLNFNVLRNNGALLFLAIGSGLTLAQMVWIMQNLRAKYVGLVFENNLLGSITELKIAAGIRKIPVAIFNEPGEKIRVSFRFNDYLFGYDEFSLNRFEKVSGFRFGCRTAKSKTHISFLEQLKSTAFKN